LAVSVTLLAISWEEAMAFSDVCISII
jgi:hypothetical protein